MSYGLIVRDSGGTITVNSLTQIARVVAFGFVNFSQSESGTKTITFPGLLVSDDVFVNSDLLSIFGAYATITRNNTTISVFYNNSNSLEAKFQVFGVRFQ